jgi:hypothetical protein
MLYQLLNLAIRHVLTWVFTAFIRSLFLPPAPKLAVSFRRL